VAELLVRDSGQGIAADALPQLFERYWQGTNTQRRSQGQGLGLGLAIAHRIVMLHGGEISAASEGEGRGATFTVRLPVSSDLPAEASGGDSLSARETDAAATSSARMLDAATSELEAASSTAYLHDLHPKSDTRSAPGAPRILLVEDHEGVAKACRRLLTSHGYHVICVATTAAALTAAENAPFDVMISDLTLPDGNGIELLSQVRSRFARVGGAGELPAIAISGSVYQEDIARSLQGGFAVHLAKPFDEEGLIAAVEKVLELVLVRSTR
jgi:CheY-like chemotaxis protein